MKLPRIPSASLTRSKRSLPRTTCSPLLPFANLPLRMFCNICFYEFGQVIFRMCRLGLRWDTGATCTFACRHGAILGFREPSAGCFGPLGLLLATALLLSVALLVPLANCSSSTRCASCVQHHISAAAIPAIVSQCFSITDHVKPRSFRKSSTKETPFAKLSWCTRSRILKPLPTTINFRAKQRQAQVGLFSLEATPFLHNRNNHQFGRGGTPKKNAPK